MKNRSLSLLQLVAWSVLQAAVWTMAGAARAQDFGTDVLFYTYARGSNGADAGAVFSDVPQSSVAFDSSATATGSASIGRLGVAAQGHAGIIGAASTRAESLARASWSDTLLFESPDPHLVSGIARIAIDYHWALDMKNPGPAGADNKTYAYVNFGTSSGWSRIADYISGTDCGSELCATTRSAVQFGSSDPTGTPVPIGPGTLTFDFLFVFGQKQPISVTLEAFTDISGSSSSFNDSAIDALHTATWGGILSVRDSSGADVAYTVSSGSGFDYTHATPVPEASSASYFLLGLLAFGAGAVARRRVLPRAA